MGSTTASGYPYPDASDNVADTAAAIQALANAIEAHTTAAGWDSITPTAANTATSKVVTFAKPFASIPQVDVTLRTGVSSASATPCQVWVTNETVNGFTMWINRGNTTTCAFGWSARAKTQ